jgi:exonuclease III
VRKKQDDILGYDIIEKNTKKGKEGLMVAARQGTFTSIEEVKNDDFNNIFVVRIKYKNETVRLVVIHGPQESDPVENRTAFFEELAVQVERCDMAGDKLILLGDFNARIEEQEDEVLALSPNGQLLRELLAEHNLKALNFQPQSTGVWTRIQKKNGTVDKSTIDYVLMKVENLSLVADMVVDEAKLFCPYRESTSKNIKSIVFSDHCAIIFTVNIQMSVHIDNGASYKTWNYTEEGYTTYKIESVEQMDAKWSPDSTQAYDFWTIEFEKLLSRCFSKKTVKMGATNNSRPAKNRSVRNILADIAKRGKIQRKIVKSYLERVIEIEVRQETLIKAAKLKQTMANLTEQEKFSPNGYWKMKKAADRNLKTEAVYSIIKENGVEVTGGKAINEAYKEEFQHRLRTREPHDGWGEYVDELNSVMRNWLNSESPSSPPFNDEELDKVIARLKKGKSPGLDDYPPEVFIYAGPGTRKSLLQLLNQIKETRSTPDQWDLMKIVTIFKKKCSKKILKYYRGIFLATVVSKIFEGLIKGRIEPDLRQVNILQAGARSNRGPGDQLFLACGCIDHYVATKQPLYITTYDYEQAFDSLWVEKCILALKNIGVSKEMLQLIYSLNKKAEVTVKTPYGLTEAFTTDPIVKQGTVLGSILCSGSTGEYCGRNEGLPVGDMMLSSLLFVDDVLDMTETEIKREKAHEEAVLFTKENNLSLSGTKC